MVRSSDEAALLAGASDRGGLGRYGEEVAAEHLVAAGLTIVARNWRCREGEVDIVALDGDVLVMCEVKTRRGVGFGTPLDAVTPAKAARLRRAIRAVTPATNSSSAGRAASCAKSRIRSLSSLMVPAILGAARRRAQHAI